MRTISVILILLLAIPVMAIKAESSSQVFFNEGCALFIKGMRNDALAKVNEGLAFYPEDYYLKALKKAIEENRQQQKQDQKQDHKKDQKQQQPQQSQQQEQQQQEQEKQQGTEQTAEQMTPQEAKMLLDAMKQEEKDKREQLNLQFGQPVPVAKDW